MKTNQFKNLSMGFFSAFIFVCALVACNPQAHIANQTINDHHHQANIRYSIEPAEITATRISAITGKQPDENELPITVVVAKRIDKVTPTN